MISRNFSHRVLAVAAMASMAMPAAAFAETEVRVDLSAQARVQFCSTVVTHLSTIEARLADLRAKLDVRVSQDRADLEERRADRMERINEIESKSDENRVKFETDLETEAKTDAERAAIVKFQAAVQAAVSARRAAFRAANVQFRAGVDAAVDAHRTQLAAAANTFQAAIKAALAKAKSDCDAGVAPSTVRTNFIAAVQAARTRLQQDRSAIVQVGTRVSELAKTRNAADARAMVAFRAAMEKARADLKAALAASAGNATSSQE